MNSDEIEITASDIKSTIYFIACLTQLQKDSSMYGSFNAKGDLSGGIFDRWINRIPESVIFDKIIFPLINSDKKVKVINDYYIYEPIEDKAGIAPDVIGIKVNNNVVPFATFNNKWVPKNGMPQIEVKSNKKTHKMVSFKYNSNYSGKYLIFAETNFRVDYIIPLIRREFFEEKNHKKMKMNDNIFIESDINGYIEQTPKVNLDSDLIGKIKLLEITTPEDFMENAVKCEIGENIEYVKYIEEAKDHRKNKLGMRY